jgi:hypothetical protein
MMHPINDESSLTICFILCQLLILTQTSPYTVHMLLFDIDLCFQIVALRDVALVVALDDNERKHALQEPVHEVAKMVCSFRMMCKHNGYT